MSEFVQFITVNFTTARLITVLVHTYIATLIYEIFNPIVFSVVDPDEKLKNFKIQLTKNKSLNMGCLLYTSPSPRDRQKARMPSSA